MCLETLQAVMVRAEQNKISVLHFFVGWNYPFFSVTLEKQKKTSGSSTKCINPIKPIDVYDVPLSSIVDSPTLKVIRVTSAISTCDYNLLLDDKEASSSESDDCRFIMSRKSESDDCRFIMSRKGDEVEPALETAVKVKMAADYFGFF